MKLQVIIASLFILATAMTMAFAGPADVLSVAVEATGEDIFRFRVTVKHADEGWEHYANRWEVFAPDGTLLGTRTLYHPHVDEQPFTRELSGVEIPPEIREVVVKAGDSVHGYTGAIQTVPLPGR